MANKKVLSSPRILELKKQKRKASSKKFIIFVVIFLIIFFSLAALSRISGFKIRTISILGNRIVETKDIESIVQNDLEGHYLFLFPKNNFLIYPKNKIKKDLAITYKRLKDISLDASNIKNISINVSEYDGKYLWCGNLIPALRSNLNDNKCYFLDDSGYIFDEAPYFSGKVYFKFYGSIEGDKIIGNNYLPKNFNKIVAFKKNLEDVNLNPTNFWVTYHPEGDEGTFSLSGEPVMSPYVIFNMDSDYAKIAENLQSALGVEPLRTDIQNKFSTLQYLDLRFGNKVYYKFK